MSGPWFAALRDFDAKWYPQLAGTALGEKQLGHDQNAERWGMLCRDWRALVDAATASVVGAADGAEVASLLPDAEAMAELPLARLRSDLALAEQIPLSDLDDSPRMTLDIHLAVQRLLDALPRLLDEVESLRGDVYLWAIGELDATAAIQSLAETLGYPTPWKASDGD